jgi:hypothetical protein
MMRESEMLERREKRKAAAGGAKEKEAPPPPQKAPSRRTEEEASGGAPAAVESKSPKPLIPRLDLSRESLNGLPSRSPSRDSRIPTRPAKFDPWARQVSFCRDRFCPSGD